MDQNLEPNYRPRHYCTCPKVAKLTNIQVIQDVQARHLEQTWTNPPHMTVKTDSPKPSRRPSYHSDWSDDKDGKDNQARVPIAKTMPQRPQPSISSGTLRKPKTVPKSTDIW